MWMGRCRCGPSKHKYQDWAMIFLFARWPRKRPGRYRDPWGPEPGDGCSGSRFAASGLGGERRDPGPAAAKGGGLRMRIFNAEWQPMRDLCGYAPLSWPASSPTAMATLRGGRWQGETLAGAIVTGNCSRRSVRVDMGDALSAASRRAHNAAGRARPACPRANIRKRVEKPLPFARWGMGKSPSRHPGGRR